MNQSIPSSPMIWIGAVVVAGVLLYVAFMAVDGTGLSHQHGRAAVVGREYKPPGTTYSTQLIGGQTRAVPQVTSELYLLQLELDGRRVEAAVPKSLYDSIENGDEVSVTYQRRRITGAIQVEQVTR